MNIIIVGAGEVGRHLAESLSSQSHGICVIESSESLAEELNEKLDIRVVVGSGATVTTLEEAMVAECDLLLALTSDDNTNLVAASIGKALGAKKTIARAHAAIQREEWLFDYRLHFGVDYLFSSERLSAVELAKFIRNPDALVVEEIARGRIELQQVIVSSRSSSAGRSLKELALPPRVRIGAIRRAGVTLVPGGDERLEAGDCVTMFGPPRGLTDVVALLQGNSGRQDKLNVVIFGGTEYGFALAQMLESANFSVRIFERDPKLCAELAGALHHTTVLNADATSVHNLREERVGEADFYVAVTNDDEDNVMTCLQVSHLGAKRCLALIHRSDYADALSRSGAQLGIIGAVSPREATRRDLLRFVTNEKHQTVFTLEGGSEVLQAVVSDTAPAAGKTVGEIDWPVGSGLVALLHGQQAIVPAAQDTISAGDTVYAIVTPEARKQLLRLLY